MIFVCFIILFIVNPVFPKTQIQWNAFNGSSQNLKQVQNYIKQHIKKGASDDSIIQHLKKLQVSLIDKWKTKYIASIDEYYKLTASISNYEQHQMITAKLDQLQKRIELEKYLFSMEIKTVSESIVSMTWSRLDGLNDDINKVKLDLSTRLRKELSTCYHPYIFIDRETIIEQGTVVKDAIVMEQGCVVQVNNNHPPLSFKIPGKLILIRSFRVFPNLNYNPDYSTQTNNFNYCAAPAILNHIDDYMSFKNQLLDFDGKKMVELNKNDVNKMIENARVENEQSKQVLNQLTANYLQRIHTLNDEKNQLIEKKNLLWNQFNDNLQLLSIQINHNENAIQQLKTRLETFESNIQNAEKNREMIFYTARTEFNEQGKRGIDFINEIIPHEYEKLKENMQSMNYYSSSKVIGGTLMKNINQHYITELYPVEFVIYCWLQEMPKMEDKTFKDLYTIIFAIKAKSSQKEPQAQQQILKPEVSTTQHQSRPLQTLKTQSVKNILIKDNKDQQSIYKDELSNNIWIKLKTEKIGDYNRYNYKRELNYEDLLRLVSRANQEKTYGHDNWKIPSAQDFRGLDFQQLNINPGEWYWTSTVVNITRDKVKIVKFETNNDDVALIEDDENMAYDHYFILFMPDFKMM